MTKITRRDFLKLGGLALGSLAFSPLASGPLNFDDSSLLRVATDSVSAFREPSDKSLITGTWYRDELVHVYGEVKGVDGEPKYNPIWYHVWGGFIHRSRVERVKILYNKPLDFIPEGTYQLVEVTVPMTNPYRNSKAYGWEKMNPPMYYGSVHWAVAIEAGPDGAPWYRIFDELDSNVPYYAPALHFRPIAPEDVSPLSPDVPKDQKRIEVNLSTQTLTAYEYNKPVFRTTVSTGIPAGDFKTPDGNFNVEEKVPAKHMGYSYFGLGKSGNVNLFADADNYVLPGVPWTCFFTPAGHAFHGTYWHENFGAPMSHGCVNMRTPEAKWLFRWVRPPHTVAGLSTKTSFGGELGTAVNVHY
jgi:lipoprotein-anchoring transpeptidase ErfK/SrfK